MTSINTGKVIAGALAAGLVINIVESVVNLFVLAEQADGVLAALGLEPIGGAAIGGFVVMGFVLGLLIVWLYAAIRPRFGPGPSTAVKAGFTVWFAFYFLAGSGNWMMGMVPTNLYLITLMYTFIMMLAAAYVGGMIYKED